jgi:predicted nucleic acid-binding protein
MIAIDSSLLIDFVGHDERAAAAADAALRQALASGPVVVCEVVVAELVAGLGDGAAVMEALDELGIEFSALEQRAAVRAGEMQRRYAQRRAAAAVAAPAHEAWPRTMPDFLVGAHALLQCQGLISTDVGFFRDYFKGLRVIVPKA